jgi:hypothetical protein
MAVILTITGLTTFAEDAQIEPPTVEVPAVPTYSVTFRYTSDSTASTGISYETYSDIILNEVGFKIVEDLPIGHVIYDNPETSYIDGIRVNGDTVDSFKVVTSEDVSQYVVDLRIVYDEGVLGDIARMSDGTYDWTQLLANPVVLLQLGYWALAIITVIVGLITSIFGKKTKVKTADEISSNVTNAAEVALTRIEERVTETVIAEFTPVFQTILNDMENVIKAVTISTSKSKDAPLALLDVLQDTVKSNDINAIIDNVRQAIVEKAQRDLANHDNTIATLHAIANQEPVPITPPTETRENVEPEHKSVF